MSLVKKIYHHKENDDECYGADKRIYRMGAEELFKHRIGFNRAQKSTFGKNSWYKIVKIGVFVDKVDE